MAEPIMMKHEATGKVKISYLGYSWTMLFFNWIAPLCRGDFLTFGIILALHIFIVFNTPLYVVLSCIAFPSFIWSFFWNKHYTQKLIEKGYIFADSEIKNQWAQCELEKNETTKKLVLIFVTIILILPVVAFESYMSEFGSNIENTIFSTVTNTPLSNKPANELVTANTISRNIYPTGELADIFNIGSNYTNLQREAKLAELKGKTVEWGLPVFEISKFGDRYRVSIIDNRYINCTIYIVAKDSNDINTLLSIKTGDVVHFRGTFRGETSMRSVVLDGELVHLDVNNSPISGENFSSQSAFSNLGKKTVVGHLELYREAGMFFYKIHDQSTAYTYHIGASYVFAGNNCFDDGERVKISGTLLKYLEGGSEGFAEETVTCEKM